MKNKFKLFLMLFVIILLIIMCKVILSTNKLNYVFKSGNNKFYINEEYNKNYTYITIKINDTIFPLYTTNKGRKMVNNIYYYKDNKYECFLPIINDKVITDMVCYENNILYNYYNIKGKNKDLDSFVNTINEYNKDIYLDDSEKYSKVEYIKFYNNIDKNIAITTYDGIIVNYKNIKLFDNDVYNNVISSFVDKYYIIADYSKMYEFNTFIVLNLENQEMFEIKSKYDISFDSYIQGVVDDNLYIYDKDNNSQYEVDIKNKKVNILSNGKKIKVYINNSWGYVSKGSEDIYFEDSETSLSFEMFDYVIKKNNYYYLFKKKDDVYELYRSDINNPTIYKYITIVPTIKINCDDDYIYYIDGNRLYYYSDNTGVKTVLENPELQFNKTIKYYIY